MSTRFLGWLGRRYEPAISWALRSKKLVLSGAAVILVFSGLLFSRMGGEFIPTLDEGDFVIQPVLKTGTTLTNTIQTTTQMEKILLQFPEVRQVVSRIGAAEIPTDPMSMEESDVIITLRPRHEWTTASSKDELADHFKEALSVLPGFEYEFTQPIEMRFNELITGVRADLAIKIFGEDLEILQQKGEEIERAIQHVPGASDIIVEKVAGLPQMTVRYDRQKIAKYGLNVADLNEVISMGFAGMSAGTVFEGERQFDLVLRYGKDYRQDMENLQMASIRMPNGAALPLSEFADIYYTKGPAKISRDDTRRRIVVGVNVRNSDLQTVVNEIQTIIENQIDLPIGYSIDYGGQFENLNRAKDRLLIAVPIALILIFALLYFAFGSVKESLIIYSAIPFSAVGGILLLYLRGMPFSISAGVGFIALFGIAVLNGIVLIEHFKELKAQGMSNVHKRVLVGTRERLRPVLLTASAAALGFLPMALSTSAGAEVQRPLATVVVGGLVTATVLTLIVLPVLYALFDSDSQKNSFSVKPFLFLGLFLFPAFSNAQTKHLLLEEAIETALQNNAGVRSVALRVEQAETLVGTALNPDKTEVFYRYDENEIAENRYPNKVWGLRQSIQFPTVYGAQRQVQTAAVRVEEQQYSLSERLLTREVSKAYYEVVYRQQVRDNYRFLDSLYTQFSGAATRRHEVGETHYLEKLTADTKQKEMAVLLEQSQEDILAAYHQLRHWMQSDVDFEIVSQPLPQLPLLDIDTLSHPGIGYYQEVLEMSRRTTRLEKHRLLPDVNLELFRGTNVFENARIYNAIQLGVTLPLWFGAQSSRIKGARVQTKILEQEALNFQIRLSNRAKQLLSTLHKHEKALVFYQEDGQQLAKEILSHANLAFQSGEIDFLQMVQLLENARNIEMSYLVNLHAYNLAVLEINYLMVTEER